MGWSDVRDAVVAEADAIRATVETFDGKGWDLPTRCEGWTTGAVAAHLGAVMQAQQQAFRNMLAGSEETPHYANVEHESPEATLELLRIGHAEVSAVQPLLADEHAERPVPLPFGTFPCALALDVVLLEYGTHRWDLASATDPAAELSPAAAECVLRLLPAFLGLFAVAPAAGEALAYRLEAGPTVIESAVVGGGWQLAPPPEGVPTTTVAGSPSAVALFALGRIGADDDRLSVTGDHGATFKSWFPGP